MSRKSSKRVGRGTLALCATAGFIVGVGLGALAGNVLLGMAVCGALGLAAGLYFTRDKKS